MRRVLIGYGLIPRGRARVLSRLDTGIEEVNHLSQTRLQALDLICVVLSTLRVTIRRAAEGAMLERHKLRQRVAGPLQKLSQCFVHTSTEATAMPDDVARLRREVQLASHTSMQKQ